MFQENENEDEFGSFFPLKSTNIFLNDEPFLNGQFNIESSFHSLDSDRGLNKEGAFNKKFNQSFQNIFEDKTTNFQTKKKDSLCFPKNNNPSNSDNKSRMLFTFEDITKILEENSFSEIVNQLTKDEIIDKYESDMKLLNKKRKRNRSKNKENEDKVVYKRGRKKMDDDTDRKHGKSAPDNIVKKIKSKLFDRVISFINSIVNKGNEEPDSELFKKLDYKYINQIKQELDLKLLDSPLKDLISKDISPKYLNLPSNSNRVNMEKILENERDDETIMFSVNLTFREFIDLFCLKKTLKDIESSDKIVNTIAQRIMTKLPRIDSLLKDIWKKNGKKYLSYFIFHLYNYELWFLTKKGRNSKKDEEDFNI